MSRAWKNMPWEEKKKTWTERHVGQMAPSTYGSGFSLTKETKHEKVLQSRSEMEPKVLAAIQSLGGNIQRASAPYSVNIDINDPYQFVDLSTAANSSRTLPNANHSIKQVATAEVINKSLPVRNNGLQPVNNNKKRKKKKKNVHGGADRNLPGSSGELTSNENPQIGMMPKSSVHSNVNSGNNKGAEKPESVKPHPVKWFCGKCSFLNSNDQGICSRCGVDKNNKNVSSAEPGKETWNCPKCRFVNFNFRNKCLKCNNLKGEKTDNSDSKSTDKGDKRTNVPGGKVNVGIGSLLPAVTDEKKDVRNGVQAKVNVQATKTPGGKKKKKKGGQGSDVLAQTNVPFNQILPGKSQGNDVVARTNDVPFNQFVPGKSRGNDVVAQTNDVPFNQFVPGKSQGNDVVAQTNYVPSNQFVPGNDGDEEVPGLVRNMAVTALTTKIMEGIIPSNRIQAHMSEQARMIVATDIATKIIEGKDMSGNPLNEDQTRAIDQIRMVIAEEIAYNIIAGGHVDMGMGNVADLAQDINNMILNAPVNGAPSVNMVAPANMIPPANVIQPLMGPMNGTPPVNMSRVNIMPPVNVIQPLMGPNASIMAPFLPQRVNPVMGGMMGRNIIPPAEAGKRKTIWPVNGHQPPKRQKGGKKNRNPKKTV